MYKLIFTQSYEKSEHFFLKKHPELFEKYAIILKLLEKNPFHPSLRLHRLKGKLKNLHSVSITLQYRVTLFLEIKEKEIVFVKIGKHDEVY